MRHWLGTTITFANVIVKHLGTEKSSRSTREKLVYCCCINMEKGLVLIARQHACKHAWCNPCWTMAMFGEDTTESQRVVAGKRRRATRAVTEYVELWRYNKVCIISCSICAFKIFIIKMEFIFIAILAFLHILRNESSIEMSFGAQAPISDESKVEVIFDTSVNYSDKNERDHSMQNGICHWWKDG